MFEETDVHGKGLKLHTPQTATRLGNGTGKYLPTWYPNGNRYDLYVKKCV